MGHRPRVKSRRQKQIADCNEGVPVVGYGGGRPRITGEGMIYIVWKQSEDWRGFTIDRMFPVHDSALEYVNSARADGIFRTVTTLLTA